MTASLNRRNFLQIAGLAGAAGTVGCTHREAGQLVSLLAPSDETIPGVASWYATTCRECPAGCGMIVRTREGRATKVEGNPAHPLSRGGLCVRGQASLQGLYNPDRFRGPLQRKPNGAIDAIGWDGALKLLAEKLTPLVAGTMKNRVAIISGARGPAMDKLVRDWLAAFNSAHSLIHEPFSHEPLREANRVLFGKAVVSTPLIETADYLISFGADYLETWLAPVAFTRDFARLRGSHTDPLNFSDDAAMRRPGKIVHIEPRLSLTASNADHWHAAVPGSEAQVALAMVHTIVSKGLSPSLPAADSSRLRAFLAPYAAASVSAMSGLSAAIIEKLAAEFVAAKSSVAIGGGAAVSGERATELMMAVQLLNYVAGRIGSSVRLDETFNPPQPASASEWKSLVEAMKAGQVEVLLIHGANPLHGLPLEMGIAEAMRKVPLVVSLSSYPDETTELAHLILPDHTPLEQWGDYRPAPGVHSLMQPAMNPVYDTLQSADVLLSVARMAGGKAAGAFPQESFQGYLKEIWRAEYGATVAVDFETFWNESLRRGGHWSQSDGITVAGRAVVRESLSASALDGAFPSVPKMAGGEFHLHAYPSSRFYDGRGANRPWLHEIPDPITNISWDGWVELHPETAKGLGVVEGDVVIVQSAAGMVEAPAYIYEGIRKDTVAMPLGLGHTSFGRYARDVGANPMRLLGARADARSGALAYAGTTVKLTKAARNTALARADGSLTDHGRGFSQIIPLSQILGGAATQVADSSPETGHEAGRHLASVHYPDNYPPHEHKDYRWGMAINLNSCTGCGACVASCYAENNIPVVGKQQVANGRNMAWIRVERYIEKVSDTPDVRFSPMMCQQCDNAPCEPVCPVYATQHSSEGLNMQTYNRCVGTRYCSNNCPYKVRTFNWFDYGFDEPLNLQLNPDVSVRSKGIMEKCTFCVQRIRGAKDHARDEGRLVADGEATPACAQSCPAQAIVFGNLLDPQSAVSKLSANQHGYKVLDELNTKPAITYLPRVKQA